MCIMEVFRVGNEFMKKGNVMFGLFRKRAENRRKMKEAEFSVSIEDKFGVFHFDQKCGWFTGQIDWLGSMEEIYLDKDLDDDTAKTALQTLHMLMENVEYWDIRLRSYAAGELTVLANDWKEESDLEIKEEDFAERISCPSIHIDNKGEFEAVFDDDNMFAGHWIVVRVDNKGELKDVDIEG